VELADAQIQVNIAAQERLNRNKMPALDSADQL
jgi:hypothetical protein